MKIAILGNAGSGKTTLAHTLHKKLGIPLIHLDQYQWLPGWQKRDRDEFELIHKELCDRNEWIMDGIATRFLEYRIAKADIIIFLDFPNYRCLWRVLKRSMLHFGTANRVEGCYEGVPSWKFVKYIWDYDKCVRPKVLALLKKYELEKKIYILKNDIDHKNLHI